MRVLFQIILLLISPILCFSINDNTAKYDSTENFLAYRSDLYVGQVFYLPLHSNSTQEGFSGFHKDYVYDIMNLEKNVYCSNGNRSTLNDSIVGKYFLVLDVLKHPNNSKLKLDKDDKFIKLLNLSNGDTLYYDYSSKYVASFPFIVDGFYKKKAENIGEIFFSRKDEWLNKMPFEDINTKKKVIIKPNTEWFLKELKIVPVYNFCKITAIIRNKSGQEIEFCFENLFNTEYFFLKKHIESFKKNHPDKWNDINKRIIKAGFTKEMAILSWGDPFRIEKIGNLEYLDYGSDRVVIENGLIKYIQSLDQ